VQFRADFSCYVSIATLMESSGKNMWLTMDKQTGGSVSITPTWLELAEDMSLLPEMVKKRLFHFFG